MKQKLALCCTIAARPKILILDEPTVGVDPVSRNELWNIILSYLKEVQGYCIFSTAYLEEADFCDLVLMLNDGKLLLQGSKESLLNKLPHQTYSLEDTKDNYQQALKKALQLTFRDNANSPILDICPRPSFFLYSLFFLRLFFRSLTKRFSSRFYLSYRVLQSACSSP